MAEVITNKAAAACGCKRTAGDGVKPGWLPGSAFLLQLEEKLLKGADGLFGFFCGEVDDNVVNTGLVLHDCDFSFFCDEDVCPVAGGDGVCGAHVYSICVCVRGGRVASYTVQGCEPGQVFCRILPCDGGSVTC